MAKFDVFGDGVVSEVSYKDFLILLSRLAETCSILSRSYIVNHASGLADFDNEYFILNKEKIQKQFLVASEEIEDKLLGEQINNLVALLDKLSKIDENIITAYRNAIIKKSKNINARIKLKNRVYRCLYQSHNPPPLMVIQFAQESAILLPELEILHNAILKRIDRMSKD
jgi:hypothetical protein